MKIAVTGKGGSGKTTVASGLSLLFAQEGRQVIAVDCDPDINLGLALDFPHPEKIIPISQMKELIAERTESDLDRPKGFFKLNPRVDDIPAKFCPEHRNIRLIVMGKVNKAGGGCLCPENTLIKNLISHLIVNTKDVVILDMVAGTEHLGRGTAGAVDAFCVVVEPTLLGVQTASHIKSLAQELGVKKTFFIGNKVNSRQDIDFLKDNLDLTGFTPLEKSPDREQMRNSLTGFISFNQNILEHRGRFVFDEKLKREFQGIYNEIAEKIIDNAAISDSKIKNR